MKTNKKTESKNSKVESIKHRWQKAFLNTPTSFAYSLFFGLLTLHLGALAAFFYFSWGAFFTFLALYALSALGITVGFHRLLSHRSFRLPLFFERLWTSIGCLALEGGPISWVAEHRQHHLKSDTELDPYDINKGFWYAHMTWIFEKRPKQYLEKRKKHFAPDLLRDPYYRWLEKNFWVFNLVLGLLLFFFGGLDYLLWGVFFRVSFTFHVTWFVNSASHLWGYRPFKKHRATNNWWVAILSFGEGWHNNHHAFPNSARHGLRFWEFDLSWLIIWTHAKLGIAKNIRKPQPDLLPWKKKLA